MNYGHLTASAPGAFAITPSDTDRFLAAGIYVGTTGNVKVTGEDEEDVTFNNVPAGAVLSIRATRVYATGTTASDLVGFQPD